MKSLCILGAALIALNAQADTCHTQLLQQPIQLMAQRAQIMKQVAAYKWYNAPNHQATAYSAGQEVKVLQGTQALAKQLRLPTWALLVFVQIQMDLSKQIEAHWIQYWNLPSTPSDQKPTAKTLVDLSQLRQQITKIDSQLYPTISHAFSAIDDCSVHQMYPVYQLYFGKIAGIPTQPNYGKVYLQALKGLDD